jgi:hypothetical protein
MGNVVSMLSYIANSLKIFCRNCAGEKFDVSDPTKSRIEDDVLRLESDAGGVILLPLQAIISITIPAPENLLVGQFRQLMSAAEFRPYILVDTADGTRSARPMQSGKSRLPMLMVRFCISAESAF